MYRPLTVLFLALATAVAALSPAAADRNRDREDRNREDRSREDRSREDRSREDRSREDRSRDRDDRTSLGLQEALRISAENAVARTGRPNGFFKNLAIKILMPRQLAPAEKLLRTIGAGSLADQFIRSMNRAAERAAPEAKSIFSDAIREITFDDVRRILTGGDDAATRYFREKTTPRLTTAFRPVVRKAMGEVDVTRKLDALTSRLPPLPGVSRDSLDLESYVVDEALRGLFHVMADEERQIRRDPVARVTDLLREVFGR